MRISPPPKTQKLINGADGVPLCISERGNGEPIVFVHGTAASAGRWQAVSDSFTSTRRVIEYDRRGRGQSGDANGYELAAEVSDLLSVSQSVGHGQNIDVVAHSYGALIALAALCQELPNFRRLVVYEAPLAIPGRCEFFDIDQVNALEKEREGLGDEAAVIFFLRHFPRASEAEIATLQTSPLWKERIAAAHTLVRELRAAQAFAPDAGKLRQSTVPCLILLGSDSMTPFQTSANALNNWLPNSKLTALPGQRHMGMDTNPELMFAVINQFLSQ